MKKRKIKKKIKKVRKSEKVREKKVREKNGPRMSELVPKGQKWSQKVHYGLKWSSMVPNGPKLSTTTKNHDHKFNIMAFITRFKLVLVSQTISELMTELINNRQSCL